MSNSVLRTDTVVFDSIGHLNMFSGVEVKLPDNIPDDCNLVCYRVSGGDIYFYELYKETDEELLSWDEGCWEYSSKSLQKELDFDKSCLSYRYIYVRVNQKPKDDVNYLFTPQCLIGVETDYGYILSVNQFSEYFRPSIYVYTTESLSKEYLIDVHNLKYYISDESDETVSFDEYLNMFYNE